MDDAFLVRGIESLGDLPSDIKRLDDRQACRPGPRNPFRQRVPSTSSSTRARIGKPAPTVASSIP